MVQFSCLLLGWVLRGALAWVNTGKKLLPEKRLCLLQGFLLVTRGGPLASSLERSCRSEPGLGLLPPILLPSYLNSDRPFSLTHIFTFSPAFNIVHLSEFSPSVLKTLSFPHMHKTNKNPICYQEQQFLITRNVWVPRGVIFFWIFWPRSCNHLPPVKTSLPLKLCIPTQASKEPFLHSKYFSPCFIKRPPRLCDFNIIN